MFSPVPLSERITIFQLVTEESGIGVKSQGVKGLENCPARRGKIEMCFFLLLECEACDGESMALIKRFSANGQKLECNWQFCRQRMLEKKRNGL